MSYTSDRLPHFRSGFETSSVGHGSLKTKPRMPGPFPPVTVELGEVGTTPKVKHQQQTGWPCERTLTLIGQHKAWAHFQGTPPRTLFFFSPFFFRDRQTNDEWKLFSYHVSVRCWCGWSVLILIFLSAPPPPLPPPLPHIKTILSE